MINGDTESGFLFVVTTKSNHSKVSAHYTRLSKARSHLARRDHAHRRQQKKLSQLLLNSHNHSRTLLPATDIPSLPRESPAQAKPCYPISSINELDNSVVCEDAYDQVISVNELLDIFQPSDPSYAQDDGVESPSPLTDNVSNPDHIHRETLCPPYTSAPAHQHMDLPTQNENYSEESCRDSRIVGKGSSDEGSFFDSSITEITSTLDPFLQLPVEISPQENSLIHFYLLVGRQSLLGTSPIAKCCPALEVARAVMQKCPIYTLGHVIVSESLLSRLTRRPLRRFIYQRYGQMYRALNVLLSDAAVSAYRKLWAMIQVAMVECTVQRFDLQALHTAAIDDFVESQGNMFHYLPSAEDDGFAQLAIRLYAARFARADLSISSQHRFETSKIRFLHMLETIDMWQSQSGTPGFSSMKSVSCKHNATRTTCELDLVSDYLNNLIDTPRHRETSSIIQNYRDAMFCSLSLIMIYAECQLCPLTARSFLCLVQKCMCDSTTLISENGHGLDKLHPVAALYAIGYTRDQIFPDIGYNRAFRMSQILVDSQAILSILSPTTKNRLIKWMVETALAVSHSHDNVQRRSSSQLDFSQNRLGALELEIDDAWRCTQKSGIT